jgi:hypothetical protein
MKAYIKNIEGLNEYLGYENDGNAYSGEEIGYGEKAIIFKDVTELCHGEDDDEKFEDFCVNAEIGQFINYKEKRICKVINSNGDAENVYEDENGEIHGF